MYSFKKEVNNKRRVEYKQPMNDAIALLAVCDLFTNSNHDCQKFCSCF